MTVKLTVGCRNDLASAIIAKIDAGASNGVARIYTAPVPAGPSTAISTQIVLAEHTLSDPSGTVSGGVLTFSTIADDNSANASGDAAFVRFFDSDGNAVADATVSATGGGGDIQMNTISIVAGGPIRFTSLAWTMPGG